MLRRDTSPIVFPLLVAAVATVGLMGLAGCSHNRYYRLSDDNYTPNPHPESVRLFMGEVSDPYVEVALVDSFPDDSDSSAVRKRQYEDLRAKAARLGADAVIEVRTLKEEHRGYMVDPAVPFKSWKQGEFELEFVRGKAIRYLAPEEALGTTEAEWEEREPAPKEDDVFGQ